MATRPITLALLALSAGVAAAAAFTLTTPEAGGLASGPGDDGTLRVGLRACAAGERLVADGAGWACRAAAAHVHAELAAPGTLGDPANPLAWTRLAGVPGPLADGEDAVGVLSVTAGEGLAGGAAGPGGAITLGLAPGVVAPRLHGHAGACPAGATAVALGRQTLCVTYLGDPLTHAAATLRAWSQHEGAELCELDQLVVACHAGLTPVVGAWLGDRTRDDEALVVNTTRCEDLDGVAATPQARAAYACLVVDPL